MDEKIIIGISDMNVAQKGGVLATYALGSCVGICLYDASRQVGGLSHILLPESRECHSGKLEPMKYADTAIPLLVQKMRMMGVRPTSIRAKIAGGASMFGRPTSTNSSLQIGERNILSVRRTLQDLRIPIIAEDVGKNFGRTQFFDTATGEMKIKSMTHGFQSY